MPKRASVSSSASQDSDTAQFVSIALFSGVGLLISIVVVICSMYGLFCPGFRNRAEGRCRRAW
jgi:hypothetical protein